MAAVGLVGLEGGVGAGEVDLLADELLDAGAGAGRVVVDRRVAAGVLVRLDGRLDGVLLGGRAFAAERAGEAVGRGGGRAAGRGCAAGAAGSAGVVVAAAGREGEGAGQGHGAGREGAAGTHESHGGFPCLWGCSGFGAMRRLSRPAYPSRTLGGPDDGTPSLGELRVNAGQRLGAMRFSPGGTAPQEPVCVDAADRRTGTNADFGPEAGVESDSCLSSRSLGGIAQVG